MKKKTQKGYSCTRIKWWYCCILQTTFYRCNLTGASFVNANLTGAKFLSFTLDEAVLRGANLRDAEFSGMWSKVFFILFCFVPSTVCASVYRMFIYSLLNSHAAC